ncbi:MAG: NAD(P)H-hydrate dehydratase [Candidatus Micrarchaeia archaeon]|jgi:NAD(P)H-hydrate epimerase
MDHLLCNPSPKRASHKGQNGVVLVIGGSKTYHGAPVLATRAAVRFCDLVYFFSTPENRSVIKKMKISTANVICVPKSKFKFALAHATCVLVGNGMDADAKTGAMVTMVLRSKKRCVIDAAALRVLPVKLLHKNAILTPHAREFEAAFGLPADGGNARAMAEKYGCTILLKGVQDIVASGGRLVKVKGGNAGMTKGGTGDVLAGLCAALFSRCGDPLRAAYTASRLNKRAGELLYKHYHYNFSSEDLADELAYAAVHMP